MTRLLLKFPWFVSAPVILALVAALAFGANWLMASEFERSFLNEADPLAAGGGAPSGQPTTSSPAPTATLPAADPASTAIAATEETEPPAATAEPEPTQPPASEPAVILEGQWRDGAPGHNGSGVARIIRTAEGKLVLRVEDFSVTNGPDLFVVLSPSEDGYADGSLNLGDLKATDGNFNYDIPEGTDLAQYKSVVVWCGSFDITFAFATLEEV